MNKLKLKKLEFFFKDNWIVIITIFVFSIMLILVNYSFGALTLARIEEDNLLREMQQLKNRVDIVKANAELKNDQIRIYTKMLAAMIPESEDFFTIIYALEKISIETGFIISNYTVKVSSTTRNKISLVIAGKGDVDTFMKFLQNYNYIGGRLATSETIQFSGTDVDTQVNLNFYNKEYVPGKDIVPQLSPKDLEKLAAIQDKVQIDFTEEQEVLGTDYDITDNPFE